MATSTSEEHESGGLAHGMHACPAMGGKRAGVRDVGIFLLAAAALSACGGAGQETAEVARAARQLDAAGEAGAREDPQASYYLDLAERELYRARVQARVGDAEGARGWAARAGSDAALASMLAIESATRGAARRTEEEAEALSRSVPSAPPPKPAAVIR